MSRRLQYRLLLCVLALGIGIALAPLASAHAQLRMSVPAQNATVPTAPAQVVLTFSEETSPTKSGGSVIDASGATVSTGFQVDLNERTKMTIPLKPGLGPGTYTVKWNSFTEDDSGVLDGTFVFTVGTGNAAGATTGATTGASAVAPTAAAATAGTTARATTGAVPTASGIPGVTLVPAMSTPAASTATTTNTGGGGVPPLVWIVVVVVVIGVIAFAARFVAAQRHAP